jgi:hypothetical protein
MLACSSYAVLKVEYSLQAQLLHTAHCASETSSTSQCTTTALAHTQAVHASSQKHAVTATTGAAAELSSKHFTSLCVQVRAVHAKAHATAAADSSKRAPADADAATWDQLPPDAIEQLSAPVALWYRGRSSRQNRSASGSNSPTAAAPAGRSSSSSGSGGSSSGTTPTNGSSSSAATTGSSTGLGHAVIDGFLGEEWAPLVAKDCERVAAAGRMSSGPGAEAMAWIEPKELEQVSTVVYCSTV